MKKFTKALLCALTGLTMVFAAACGPKETPPDPNDNSNRVVSDPETRPLSMSISAFDGNFNPFFSTSLSDAQIISQTQAQLISADKDGNPVAGEDWPTVAQDFKITYKNSAGTVVSNGTQDGTTEYEFLIKDGMKFSDGTALTIKDVLFNFYVYLDPVYTGSNTMYSINIKGLSAYRANDSTKQDGTGSDNSAYYAAAQARLDNLVSWSNGDITTLTDEMKNDRDRIYALFKEELESDWNSNESSWSTTYKDEYAFTAAWQAYLLLEGVVYDQQKQESNGTYSDIKDANGKKLTTLNEWATDAHGGTPGTIGAQDIIDDIDALTTPEKIQAKMAELGEGATEDYAELQITKEYCVNRVYENYANQSGILTIIGGYVTGSTALNEFMAEERAKAIANSSHPVDSISGITTSKTSNFNGKELGKEQDVLKVVVNGVDPAAIWQFGVSIAPMSYYSSKNYNGVNYIDTFDGVTKFGIKARDPKFFSDVLRSTDKNGLPMGAGPYMASSIRGGAAQSDNDFERNNIIYYERNPYFETMGAQIDNAKIKYLRYQVIDEDKIISSIADDNGVDYGEPNATSTNLTTVGGNPILAHVDYNTNGYGYIGINPKYVPDIEVRRAIMMSMDTASIKRNYYGDLATTIYRPMSLTSWAYPTGTNSLPDELKFQTNANTIKKVITDAGYTDRGDGVYKKGDHALVYTFTIAGASQDHPAYQLFMDSAKTLNKIGFKITVLNDPQALKKMAGGELAVWAAAWSSGIDPDMYQVYHKDSTATSVLNWGYPTILNGADGDGYEEEREIITDLSTLIENARKTTSQPERASIYEDCLDLIMDLAVELPTYQRHDLCVYRGDIIDTSTLNPEPNDKLGLISEIWKVNYYLA